MSLGMESKLLLYTVQREAVETPTAYNWIVTCYYEVNA
jgi:hypothetical protein